MDGRSLEATRMLAHGLLGAGRYAAARDLLLGVAAADPDDTGALRALARARLMLGEYAEAEPVARGLAERETGRDRICALFFHAHALWGCGREAECRRVVERYAALRAESVSGPK